MSQETCDETSRDRRGRKRPLIEDLSDDESIDGKTRNTKRLDGKQTASQKDSVLSKLRQRLPRDSSDEEKNSNSNAHSFYGRSTRRTRQQEHPNHENEEGEHDEDGKVAPLKQTRRNTGREYRRMRRDQIVGKNSTLYFPFSVYPNKRKYQKDSQRLVFVGTVNEGLFPVASFRLGTEGVRRDKQNAYDTQGNCLMRNVFWAVAFEFRL